MLVFDKVVMVSVLSSSLSSSVVGVEKMVVLSRIDRNWTTHIDSMSKLREGIHLRSYAQTNPLQDYVREGFQMFDNIRQSTWFHIYHFCCIKNCS